MPIYFMMQSNLHVAIIMDGNGRWATRRGLPRAAGHSAGAEALRRIVEAAPECGVAVLTVYAFSSDNWKRPPAEVAGLMVLLELYLRSEAPRCRTNRVKMSVIGRRDRLPDAVRAAIESAERETADCGNLELRLAVDYSARDAILEASHRSGGSRMTRESFEELLGEAKPVDILIRTGGEQRLSDFLLWECAYAELIFTNRMWPDYTAHDLAGAVQQYARRDRRFGAIPQPSAVLHDHWLR